MIEFEKRIIKPEDHDVLFRRVSEFLEQNIGQNLANKAEAGRGGSEHGYQLIAASISGRLARELGCNENKAKALSMSAGVCFPKYGHEGLKAVRQYIVDRNIDLDLETLDFTIAAYYLARYWLRGPRKPVIIDAYYDAAYDYFFGIDQNEESKIVRLAQETIMDVKKAAPFYDGYSGDLLYNATQELVDLAKANKALTKGTLLEPYREKINAYQFPTLTEEERQDVYNRLDRFVEVFAHHPESMAERNITPEEAVMTYIYMAD